MWCSLYSWLLCHLSKCVIVFDRWSFPYPVSYILQASDQDIIPVDGSTSSQPDELVSLVGHSEAEGMDIQHSEASQSSTTDPQSSELERNDGSTSSLSLSSERLEEGGIVALPPPGEGVLTASRRSESSNAVVLGSRTITILSSSNNSTQQATFLQSIGSEISSLATYQPTSSSSPHLESSVDPSSSQLSLDSSNGSSSQGDVSQSEVEVEEGLQFTTGTRTSSDSNLHSQTGTLERTSSASASRSSSSLAGTSVIVEPSNSRGTPRERSASEGQHQQRPSQPHSPPTDDDSGNSSRSTGTNKLVFLAIHILRLLVLSWPPPSW